MANTQATGRIGDLGLNNKVVLADQQDLTLDEKSQVLDNILTQDQKDVLNGGGSSSSLTPDQIAAIDSISSKADEFTEWEFSGEIAGYDDLNVVIESVYEGAAFDYKLYSGDTFIAGLTDSSDSLTVVDFTTIDATKRITATRKRVLYTGDADKLTDAQKDLLNNLEGGKIVIVTDGYGLTVKDESNGDSGIPVLNIGDKDGTVTYGAVLRVNGVAHDPASASESSVVISGATTDYVEDVGHVEMPPSIKIGGKEVATVDQLREKADEFTEWDFGDVGSERGFHVKVERTSEEEYPPAMRYRFTLLDYDDGEERTIDTIYEGSDDIVSIEFQDEVSTSLIYATRKRVLRTGDASFASIPSATSTSDVVSCFNQLLAALKGTSPST